MTTSGDGGSISGLGLEVLLGEAVRGLATLDATAMESLAESLATPEQRVALPRSAAEWRRASAQRWVLEHLLGGTAQRLAMLRRIGRRQGGFDGYHDASGEAPEPASESN